MLEIIEDDRAIKLDVATRIASYLKRDAKAITVNPVTGNITVHMQDNTIAQLQFTHWAIARDTSVLNSFVLDGEIGLGKCDHTACMCGQTVLASDGFYRTIVPHSGVWKAVRV